MAEVQVVPLRGCQGRSIAGTAMIHFFWSAVTQAWFAIAQACNGDMTFAVFQPFVLWVTPSFAGLLLEICVALNMALTCTYCLYLKPQLLMLADGAFLIMSVHGIRL